MTESEKASFKPSMPHDIRIFQSFLSEEMEKYAIETSLQAVETHKQFKDIAMFIKLAFDKKFPSTTSTEGVFHCICGTHFCASVTHETHGYLHLQVDQVHLILFKSKDNPYRVAEPSS